jgi:glycosyltransferase 2 family protein
LRIAALLLVGWFVHGSVSDAFGKLSQHEWHVQPAWLVAAGAIYAIGLTPMGWFWQQTLTALGCPTPLGPAMCAYFLGHLGKYVPGKAMSVILRVAAVRKWVTSTRIALISALIETLTMMAVGALLAAVMSAFVMPSDYIVSLIALGMAVAVGLPTLPPIARRLAGFGLDRAKSKADSAGSPEIDVAANLQAIDFRLLSKGWAAAAVCWLLLSISLWATLRAIGVENLSLVDDLPRMIAVVGFAVVAGFISQLPAGLGVREGVLLKLLIPVCGEVNALVATVLMRLVWLMSELTVCGILYLAGKTKSKSVAT